MRSFLLGRLAIIAVLLLATSSVALAEDFKIVGWNLESGRADPKVLAKQIVDIKNGDLFGFSEVIDADAPTFVAGCAKSNPSAQFQSLLGTTGGADRLLIVYNSSRLELVGGRQELSDLKFGGGRAPMFARFKSTKTGDEFLFMVNHLHRSGTPFQNGKTKRMLQTEGLQKWLEKQTLPVVMCGDYNYDVATKGPNKGKGNAEGEVFLNSSEVKWVKHDPFIPTQASSHASVLDFVFLAGPAKHWQASCKAIDIGPLSSADVVNSDHRALVADLKTTTGRGPSPLSAKMSPRTDDSDVRARQKKRDEILRKIDQLQRELIDLRQAVRELAED